MNSQQPQLQILGTYIDGSRRDITNLADCRSSAPQFLTVSNSTPSKGLVTAVGFGGDLQITASIPGTALSVSHRFVTGQGKYTDVVLTPPRTTYAVGETVLLSTFFKYESGEQVPAGLPVVSSDPSTIAIVSTNQGQFAQALKMGTAVLNVTLNQGDIHLTTSLTVQVKASDHRLGLQLPVVKG